MALLQPIRRLSTRLSLNLVQVFQISLLLLLLPIISVRAAELKLNQEDIIRLTLENSSPILLAKLDYQISKAENDASPMDFDIRLTAEPFYKKEKKVSNFTTEDFAIKNISYGTSFGTKKKFLFGTNFEFSFQTLRMKTSSTQAFIESWRQVATQFKITQPFLKGFGFAANLAPERKAEAKMNRYHWDFVATVDEELKQNLTLYWSLYEAWKKMNAQSESVKISKNNFNREQALYEKGNKSKVDYLLAVADLETSKAKFELTKSDYLTASEKLSREVLSNPLDVIIPAITESKSQEHIQNKTTKTHAKVFKLEYDVLETESDLKKAKNALLPQLDVSFEYLSSGLNNRHTPAVHDVMRYKFPSWEVEFIFKLPIPDRVNRGEYSKQVAIRDRKETSVFKEKFKLQSDLIKASNLMNKNTENYLSMKKRLKTELEKTSYKQQLYNLGKISLQEYLDSVNDFNDLKLNVNREFVSLQKEKLKIQEITGEIGGKYKEEFISSLTLNQ